MRAVAGQSARDLFSEYLMVLMSWGKTGLRTLLVLRTFHVWGNKRWEWWMKYWKVSYSKKYRKDVAWWCLSGKVASSRYQIMSKGNVEALSLGDRRVSLQDWDDVPASEQSNILLFDVCLKAEWVINDNGKRWGTDGWRLESCGDGWVDELVLCRWRIAAHSYYSTSSEEF